MCPCYRRLLYHAQNKKPSCHPIAVTRQLLEDGGFKQDRGDWFHDDLFATCHFEGSTIYIEFGEHWVAKKFVHEFQNIFYDLTNTELRLGVLMS